MPYNEAIAACIAPCLPRDGNFTQKKMFGGICYLFNGNMGLGIHKDWLVVRCGETAAEKWMAKPGIRPFDITGRPMRGWIMADERLWGNTEERKRLVQLGVDFARELPPK